MNYDLEDKLVIGAQIKIGEEYAKDSTLFQAGDIITLIEGEFEYDNGLYTEYQSCPSIVNDGEYESIYHLFGNKLEDFKDCEVISL